MRRRGPVRKAEAGLAEPCVLVTVQGEEHGHSARCAELGCCLGSASDFLRDFGQVTHLL